MNEKKLKKHNIKNIKFNLSSDKYLAQADLNRIRADFIIDCCAEPSVEISKANPHLVFNSNLKSTLNLLEIAKKKNLRLFIFQLQEFTLLKKLIVYLVRLSIKVNYLKKSKLMKTFQLSLLYLFMDLQN